MNPGDKVRVKDNPSRVGTLTSQPAIGEGRRRRLVVDFPDGTEPVLEASLEKVERETRDPYLLMMRGEYGRVQDLRGSLTHYRLTGKLAELIYSLHTTNTQFLPYQFKPVLNYLDSPSKGLVIADEVGLGKTIEAGLIWTELRAREDARRLLVVCPAMLKDKWRTELLDRFGVKADIVDVGELLARLEQAKLRPLDEFALIVSMQGLRPPRTWDSKDAPSERPAAKLARFLSESDDADKLLDLVIVDEAHYLRNEETLTNLSGRLLRPVANGMVLLSATPIQMRSRDLFNLLHLLDADGFPHEWTYDRSVEANAPIVRLRDRVLREVVPPKEFLAAIDEALALRFLEDTEQLEHLRANPPDAEVLSTARGRSLLAEQLNRMNPRAAVVTRTLKREVDELRVHRESTTLDVRLTTAERDFYDAITEAVRAYCEELDVPEGFIVTVPQRQMSSCMAAACAGWRKRDTAIDEESLYELGIEPAENGLGLESSEQSELMRLLVRISADSVDLDVLRRNDSKFERLASALKDYWREYPDKKIVLFAFYKNTLYYLRDRLEEIGVEAAVLHGGMEKGAILERFANPRGPKILLSSEVASEGVDLQFSSLVVNYDMPWNPAKIEQRIGRIDRIGQMERQILVWNLVYADTLDEVVYERLLSRLNVFRSALGSMEEVLGERVRELTTHLLSHRMSKKAAEDAVDQAAVAIENLRREQEHLEAHATQLIGHGDFIQRKVRAADELGRYIRGIDLLAYVRDYLEKTYPGTRFFVSEERPLEADLDFAVDGRVHFKQFVDQHRLHGRTQILAQNPPKLLFENRVGASPRGIEKITQDHPLVRFVAEGQRNANRSMYFPTAAIDLPGGTVPGLPTGLYVFVVMRWTLSGARDMERLVYQAAALDGTMVLDPDLAERLVDTAAQRGRDWHGAARSSLDHHAVAAAQDRCRADLEEQFVATKAAFERENIDRVRSMVGQLELDLSQRRQRIQARISELESSRDPKKLRVVPAERGKIRILEQKYGDRIAELKMHQMAVPRDWPVSSGVIHVK